MVFDVLNGGASIESWTKAEKIRQDDKTINNTIGEFHQMLLGRVKGWKDLGRGDDSKVDLMKDDKSVFMELKNKHNTMNSSATNKVRDVLEKISKSNPNSKVYWGYIIGSKGKSGETVWKIEGKKVNQNIRKIWGKKVYELVTGDPNSLQKVWLALPQAILDLNGTSKSPLSTQDFEKLKEYFSYAFKD